MELDKQVTSIELSKRLHELGVKQKSLFYFVKDPYLDNEIFEITRSGEGYFFISEKYSAFTASELLELLPKFINNWIFRIEKYPSEFEVKYCDKLDEKRLNIEFDKSLPDALAKMLIHLLENNLLETNK